MPHIAIVHTEEQSQVFNPFCTALSISNTRLIITDTKRQAKLSQPLYFSLYFLCFTEFEDIEVHSRKVFNIPKEKATALKDSEEPIGPMVR